MNGIILPGEKTQAACENCQAFCSATYGYGTIKLQSGGVSPNRRKFRQTKSSPARIASKSMTCPLPRKV
jgi:hypothetical protein